MGIKHLWTILTPFCERKPLYELQGKTIAVDLSCWICEAQNIAEYQVQPRMYLRNLYFRTCYLLLLDVNPVFILEGKAPELKYDTIAARNALQFKGAKPKTDNVKTGKDRSRFNFILKQCEEMLKLMGLSCITGKGEAESLCAYLNDEGLVDGCISQDSDCFAYGAKIVYRNFSIASQGAKQASGGAVDIYDINKAKEDMDFGRNKIIAMALLCGSDYNDGVQGVGKESMLKFFEDISDEETLDRLRSWRKNSESYEKQERILSDKNICASCGHQGTLRGHNQKGCGPCGMTKGCSDQIYKAERLKIKNELQMRNKALQDPNFPNETLIKEFLIKKDHVSKLNLKWKQPNLVKFVRFTAKYLQWDEIYGFEKILPILTRWQCLNYTYLETEGLTEILHPSHIKKARNPKGIPSYEIIWSDPTEYCKNLIPDEQIEESNTTLEKLWSTIEPQELVNKAYPKLVETFLQSKIKPKKPTRRRKNDNVDEIEQMLKNTSISEPEPKKTRKISKQKVEAKDKILQSTKPTPLDNFLKRAVLQHQKVKQKQVEMEIIHLDENKCYTSTPHKFQHSEIDLSSFGDEDDDSDLSDIIESIISRKPIDLKQNLIKIRTYVKDQDSNTCHPDHLDVKENVDTNNEDDCENIDINLIKDELDLKNSSSFFISGPTEHDMFEKTFNEMLISDDNDDTIEYGYNDVWTSINKTNSSNDEAVEQNSSEQLDILYLKCDVENNLEIEYNTEIKKIEHVEDDDSFCDNYVPLIERLNKKK